MSVLGHLLWGLVLRRYSVKLWNSVCLKRAKGAEGGCYFCTPTHSLALAINVNGCVDSEQRRQARASWLNRKPEHTETKSQPHKISTCFEVSLLRRLSISLLKHVHGNWCSFHVGNSSANFRFETVYLSLQTCAWKLACAPCWKLLCKL